MLRVNQLSGFGGGLVLPPKVEVRTAGAGNTINWSPNLGPEGPKQVIMIMTCDGNLSDDPWAFAAGTFAGGPWDWVYPNGDWQAGSGFGFTGGATIRAKQTTLGGVQTVQSVVSGYASSMVQSRATFIIMRNLGSIIPLSYDGGNNQNGAGTGNEVTLNTTGAKLVVAARASAGGAGLFVGGGNPLTSVAITEQSHGYDLQPPGGVLDYTFTGSKYVIAGAAFG